MVKIKPLLRSKGADVGGNVSGLFGVHRKETNDYDNDRMVIMSIKKGESVAVFDKNNKPWELSKDSNGRLNWRKL